MVPCPNEKAAAVLRFTFVCKHSMRTEVVASAVRGIAIEHHHLAESVFLVVLLSVLAESVCLSVCLSSGIAIEHHHLAAVCLSV